ncbi:hypothetical protein GJ496_011405, partial [Pomphorhynchus laevis]
MKVLLQILRTKEVSEKEHSINERNLMLFCFNSLCITLSK